MTALTLCSGIGGVDAGLVEAGIESWGGFELDPSAPHISEQKKLIYSLNFPKGQLFLKTIQQADQEGWVGVPRNLLLLHGSQPCSEFSVASVTGKESKTSVEIAQAMVGAISALTPQFFTLENVSGFQKSQSFQVVCQGLEDNGYKFHHKVIPLLGYQSRQRLILLAGRESPFEFPPDPAPTGWWDVVRPYRRCFVPCDLSDSQVVSQKIREAFSTYFCPLLIERIRRFRRRDFHVRPSWEQCWALTNVFSDHKGGGRSNAINVWLDRELWSLPIEAIAALQGFPPWFRFSPDWAISGGGVALSVPPEFIKRLVQYNGLTGRS